MNFNNVTTKVLVSKVDKREKYSLVFLRDSRHDKKNDVWVKSPYPNTSFAAKANDKIDDLVDAVENADKFEDGNSKGVYIILKDVSFSNEPYDNKDGVKVYPRKLTVWNWEFADESPKPSKEDEPPVVEDSSDDFPF
jgi:hypothetical protein